MDQKLGQEYEGEARVRFLQDNCDAIEEIGFNRIRNNQIYLP